MKMELCVCSGHCSLTSHWGVLTSVSRRRSRSEWPSCHLPTSHWRGPGYRCHRSCCRCRPLHSWPHHHLDSIQTAWWGWMMHSGHPGSAPCCHRHGRPVDGSHAHQSHRQTWKNCTYTTTACQSSSLPRKSFDHSRRCRLCPAPPRDQPHYYGCNAKRNAFKHLTTTIPQIFLQLLHAPFSWTPRSTAVPGFIAHGLQPVWHLLLGLNQQIHQVADDVLVLVIEEGCGQTCGQTTWYKYRHHSAQATWQHSPPKTLESLTAGPCQSVIWECCALWYRNIPPQWTALPYNDSGACGST